VDFFSSDTEPAPGGSPLFWAGKRVFDILGSLLLLPLMVLMGCVLLLLNPIWNPGPLFYRQKRMGRDCKPFFPPFCPLKFRSMRPAATTAAVIRDAEGAIEQDRITPLGRFMRKCRLDEVPQIINVLLGQMSLIGPRPDCYEFALVYLKTVPGYRARHVVRPGISGLAQVTVGYVEGSEATKAKVAADHRYLAGAGVILELQIIVMTIRTIVELGGA